MATSQISTITATVNFSVCVENFDIVALTRHAESIGTPQHGCCIDDPNQKIAAPGFPDEGPSRVVAVAEVNPLIAFIAIIQLKQSWLVAIEVVEMLNQAPEPFMSWEMSQMPVQTPLMTPLVPLPEFPTLEK